MLAYLQQLNSDWNVDANLGFREFGFDRESCGRTR